jgi:hypothetical protein
VSGTCHNSAELNCYQQLKVLVPGGGVEPPRPEGRRILSPLRLPVPPSRLGKVFLLYGSANRFEHGLDWLYLSHRRSDLG